MKSWVDWLIEILFFYLQRAHKNLCTFFVYSVHINHFFPWGAWVSKVLNRIKFCHKVWLVTLCTIFKYIMSFYAEGSVRDYNETIQSFEFVAWLVLGKLTKTFCLNCIWQSNYRFLMKLDLEEACLRGWWCWDTINIYLMSSLECIHL